MKIGPTTTWWVKLQLVRRDGPYCKLCGIYLPKSKRTIDHIIPRCEGGSDELSNLRLACYPCNHGRHHLTKIGRAHV